MSLAQSGQPRLADQVFADPLGTFQQGFGYNVSADGEWLAVAYRLDNSRNIHEGSVYIYRRTETGFVLFQILRADSIQSLLLGTIDLELKGDLCIVSSTSDPVPNQIVTGAVYVFRFDGAAWRWEARLEPNDAQLPLGNAFGISLGIADSNSILVGAFSDSVPTPLPGVPSSRPRFTQRGAIYAFTKGPSGWTQTQKIKTHHPMASEGFDAEWTRCGLEIAISGDTAIIGNRQRMPLLLFVGGLFHANTLRRDSQGIWHESGQIIHLGGHYREEFGYSVAIEGDLMAIGAPVEAQNVSWVRPGYVYVYRRVAGRWTLETTLIASDATVTVSPGDVTSDRFGESVSID